MNALRAPLLGLTLFAAGCTAQQATTGMAGISAFSASATAEGAGPDAVTVETSYVSRSYQIQSIALVAPDGRRYRANAISTEIEPGYSAAAPHGIFGVAGGSTGNFGVGIGLDLGWLLNDGGGSRLPTVHGKGRIPVPDAADYRRRWHDWSVEITLSRGGTRPETRTIPAPGPRAP